MSFKNKDVSYRLIKTVNAFPMGYVFNLFIFKNQACILQVSKYSNCFSQGQFFMKS